MIPVRVRADARPVLAGEREFRMPPEHPLYAGLCPVCEARLGDRITVLILAGIAPEDRKEAGWTTGAAVAVHKDCAGG